MLLRRLCMATVTFLMIATLILPTRVGAVVTAVKDGRDCNDRDESPVEVHADQVDTAETRMVDPITIVYYVNEYELLPGIFADEGTWRNGTSGGNALADQEIYIDRSYDSSRDISFTITVTGSYTPENGASIGADLGVTLGSTQTYSFGSGTSVTVPKGEHWMILYRPAYRKYKVIEKGYVEVHQNGFVISQRQFSEKECTVKVFSHWDYTVVKATIEEENGN